MWPNISTYGKLVILIVLAWGDPMLMKYVEKRDPAILRTARQVEQKPAEPLTNELDNVFR